MAKDDNLSELSFEDALAELESVVRTMESGELALDDMIRNFERGRKLSDHCGAKLKALEKKIEILVGDSADGPQWRPFDES